MPLNIDKLRPPLQEVMDLFMWYQALDNHCISTFLQLSSEARKKRVSRLFHSGWLQQGPLPTGGVYWMPSRRARKAMKLTRARRKGLNHEQVIVAQGTAYACLAENIDKQNVADIEEHWPHLLCPGVPTHGYGVDVSERLVWLVIDRGGPPERLAQKARHVVLQRYRREVWREVIDAGDFGVVLVAPSKEKAAAVTAALPQQHINRAVVVRVVTVPELAPLLLLKGPK